ncbi:TBC1 domain family member 1 [Holothuria leucospilota]|uniref:TBC1 domain family member 1 n=1 Tax=Holothuria leucospilota TaxID=206669 RepID=A0A9Q1BKA9_HOLLE|nr:TBC1 domain family member 1 [Holothuria leucospilota]
MAAADKDKNSSTDSGMGLADSDLDSSVSDVFSPSSLNLPTISSKLVPSKPAPNVNVTPVPSVMVNRPNVRTTTGTNSVEPTSPVIMRSTTVSSDSNVSACEDQTKSNLHVKKWRSADEYGSNTDNIFTTSDVNATGRPRSTSDVRHTRSHVRVFQLSYLGSLTLDKRVTQAMLPWITAEKSRKNAERTSILLQVSEKGLLGISEKKGSVLFEHRLHNVFRLAAGHRMLFSYQWKLEEDTPSSKLFAFEAKTKEDVSRICDTVKNATKNALQIDSGSHHTTRQVGLAALEELKDNNCTMFEVLYCGRVTVSHKSAPPTLIDDAIEKFKAHEQELQKKSLEASRKRHFSCEDQLDRIDSDSKECQTPHSQSLDQLDSSGSQSSTSGSVSSIPTSDSEKDGDLLPVERERSGSGASVNSRSSVNSDGPRSVRPTVKRQDTFLRLVTSKVTSHNRTMVFQIGRSALTLISTDKKSFALTKKFTEISFCSQGIKNPEYFGFICREADTNGNIFKCYVFKVQDEATVDTVMATLRQAFSAALEESKSHVVCETCPMHTFHKLCVSVKDLAPEKALNVMRKTVETLEDKQKSALAAFLRLEKPDDQQGQNELIMTFLRSLFEQKQAIHTHDCHSVLPNTLNGSAQKFTKAKTIEKIETNAPEGAFKKAKKSLTSSFENLLSRNKSKNSPESTRKKQLVTFRSQPSEVIAKADAETSPIEESVTSSPEHQITSLQVSTSPLSVNSTPDRLQPPPAPSTSPMTPPNSLPVKHCSMTEATSTRNNSQGNDEESSSDPPQRRRSKTLGDCPSPLSPQSPPPLTSAIPLSPLEFTTPRTQQPVKKRRNRPPPLKRTMSVDMSVGSPLPLTPSTAERRRMSFRQVIFKRVVTPMSEKKTIADIAEESEVFEENTDKGHVEQGSLGQEVSTGRFPNKTAVRALWQRAIQEQILLIRMDKENSKLQDRQNAVSESKQKMGYEELTPCLKEVVQKWETILKGTEEHYYLTEVIELLKQGIPRYQSGDVWIFLRSHMEKRKASFLQPCPEHEPYAELIKHLTTHQHAILIDLGRTYPNHPYFSNPLGRGQLSLFNLLKAYSLLDTEVGYCQGLSFVAGFLLMHMEEQAAFEMLVFMMYGLGCRRQYKPDMVALQIQMYQLSRLLHDFHRELHDHLEANEVSPSFYAAPWFLTFFTSQFPLGFVARIFDMMFAQGMEAIFKVALNILGCHSDRLLRCENFEELIEYIKDDLPKMTYVELEKVILQSFNQDISKELQAFEVEYHVIQEEMLHSPILLRSGSSEQEQLESANQNLRRHNEELLEQLQTARNTINNQEKTIHELQDREVRQKKELEKLYAERSNFIITMNKLLELIPQDTLQESGINLPNINLLTRVKTTRSNSIPSLVLFPSAQDRSHQNGNKIS